MPNRIIRSAFLDSEKINSLSPACQVFFVRLMLIVDDYGNCDARPAFIRSHCYPITEVSVKKVENLLTNLQEMGLIQYYDVEGKQYLQVINFGQRLRSMRYKVPCPQSAATCRNPPPESESESESETNKSRDREKKRQADKPPDPRFKPITDLFYDYYQHINNRIKYIKKDGDFRQLKILLDKDQGQTTPDIFLAACRACQTTKYHKENFSMRYVAANISTLLNLVHVPGVSL